MKLGDDAVVVRRHHAVDRFRPDQPAPHGVAERLRARPADQDVVVEFLKSVQVYFSTVCPQGDAGADMQTLVEDAETLLDVPGVCPTTRAVQAVQHNPRFREVV